MQTTYPKLGRRTGRIGQLCLGSPKADEHRAQGAQQSSPCHLDHCSVEVYEGKGREGDEGCMALGDSRDGDIEKILHEGPSQIATTCVSSNDNGSSEIPLQYL